MTPNIWKRLKVATIMLSMPVLSVVLSMLGYSTASFIVLMLWLAPMVLLFIFQPKLKAYMAKYKADKEKQMEEMGLTEEEWYEWKKKEIKKEGERKLAEKKEKMKEKYHIEE